MKTRNLILTAVLVASALAAFVIEASVPPITPIYGIKLGIANVFTLFAFYALGTPYAFAVLLLRITLGSILTGQVISFIYSITGGLLSFFLVLLLKRFFPLKQLWVLSVLSAVMHNIGQILAAVVITQTMQIAYYLPVLIISGIVSGAITGMCAQLVLMRLEKLRWIKNN